MTLGFLQCCHVMVLIRQLQLFLIDSISGDFKMEHRLLSLPATYVPFSMLHCLTIIPIIMLTCFCRFVYLVSGCWLHMKFLFTRIMDVCLSSELWSNYMDTMHPLNEAVGLHSPNLQFVSESYLLWWSVLAAGVRVTLAQI